MTNGRLEVRIFFLLKRTILLSVEVTHPMLILPNYRLTESSQITPTIFLRVSIRSLSYNQFHGTYMHYSRF